LNSWKAPQLSKIFSKKSPFFILFSQMVDTMEAWPIQNQNAVPEAVVLAVAPRPAENQPEKGLALAVDPVPASNKLPDIPASPKIDQGQNFKMSTKIEIKRKIPSNWKFWFFLRKLPQF
jgi:hypothetical protein